MMPLHVQKNRRSRPLFLVVSSRVLVVFPSYINRPIHTYSTRSRCPLQLPPPSRRIASRPSCYSAVHWYIICTKREARPPRYCLRRRYLALVVQWTVATHNPRIETRLAARRATSRPRSRPTRRAIDIVRHAACQSLATVALHAYPVARTTGWQSATGSVRLGSRWMPRVCAGLYSCILGRHEARSRLSNRRALVRGVLVPVRRFNLRKRTIYIY